MKLNEYCFSDTNCGRLFTLQEIQGKSLSLKLQNDFAGKETTTCRGLNYFRRYVYFQIEHNFELSVYQTIHAVNKYCYQYSLKLLANLRSNEEMTLYGVNTYFNFPGEGVSLQNF